MVTNNKHGRFKTISILVGSFAVGFVVFTLYLYPIIVGKQEDVEFLDNINKQIGDEPSDNDPDNWWVYPELKPNEIYAAPQLNWSKFWPIFKNNVFWRAEWYNPNTQQWVDGTDNLNINFAKINDSTRKLTLNFTTHPTLTTDYRLLLAANYKVKDYVNKSGNQEYTLTYEVDNESFNLIFNWFDMLQYSNLIFKHGIKEVNGNKYFYFIVRRNNIPPNKHVSLDPSYQVYEGTNIAIFQQGPRVLARQSNGTLYCTFAENSDVHIAYSEDDGVTWDDVEVWGAHSSLLPSIAVDSNDVVHLVFVSAKNDADDYQLEYSNSTDWSTIVQIRDEDKFHEAPAIAIDSNDNIHIAYEKGEEGTSNDDQLCYINSTDNGGSWGTEKILTDEPDGGDDKWVPSIAIDNNDVIHIVYVIEDGFGGLDIYAHMNSSDYGGTWSGWFDDIILTGTGANELLPCLVINDNDDLMVTGYDSFNDITYRYNGSDDSGWSNGSATDEIDQNGKTPTISTTNNNTAYIMFEDNTLNDIQYYVNYTDSWIDKGIILVGDYENPTSISAQHPTIDGVKTNRPATGFAFICTNTTNTNITYFASDDLTWDTGVVEDDTVVIILIDHSPSNIRTNSTGDAWFLYNITTNSTQINNWSIVWAYGINHTETLTHNTSYSLEDILAEDKLRAYNRNENLTQETKFNSTTGDGSIGGFGEWNTHDLNYGVTYVNSGSNWTLVNATEEIVHHLFNSIGFVDREEIVGTNHTGNTIEISKTNYAKIEFNMTDTDWYDTGHYRNTSMFLHLYVNQSSASKPLLVYFVNNSYSTGQPASSPYTSLVGSINPGDSFEYTEDNSSYYDINFLINNTGFVGAVNVTSNFSIILRSTVPSAQKWDLYYADQNVSHIVSGVTHYHDYDNHTIMELTSNSGNTWATNSSTPDMYFNFISLNEEDISEVKLYANDTSNNSAWSSVHTDLVDITNYPPNPADIIVPNSDTNYTVGDTIPINYNWIGDPNLDTCWVNITLWDWNTTTLDTYIINQSLTFEMVSENSSNFTYNWDTTSMSPSNYTIAINITDDEFWANSSSDVFYIWSSNAQLLSGWFSGGNVSVNAQLLSGWFSGGNLSVNSQLISGWFSGGNVSDVNQQLLFGWFSGGNVSVNVQLLSGWFSGGNISDVNQQLLSGWFSGGNTSVINITITDEYPSNDSISIPLQPTAYVTINSGDGDIMNITWYYGTTLGAENIEVGTDNNITNGSYTELYYPITGRVTTYYWRVMANDGTSYINESFSFTTEGFPIAPRPPNIGLAVVGIIFGTLGLLSFVMFSKKKKKKKKVNKDMYMYVEEEEWLD